MIDEVEDEYGDDEPSSTRADWAALRERLLEQRRSNMRTDSLEFAWVAHRVGALIPEYKDHPLFLATLRAHWFTTTVEPSDYVPEDGDGAEGSAVRQCVVTIDPADLRANLPGVARDIERTLRQHPWAEPTGILGRGLTPSEGRAVAGTIAAIRGFGSKRS